MKQVIDDGDDVVDDHVLMIFKRKLMFENNKSKKQSITLIEIDHGKLIDEAKDIKNIIVFFI